MFGSTLFFFTLALSQLIAGPCSAAKLTQSQINAVIDAHNNYRKTEGSSNMNKIKWSEELASHASDWADACTFEHSVVKGTGQNMALSSSNATNVLSLVKAWFNEKAGYDFPNAQCTPGAVCGHYTQVVWDTTAEIGCGVKTCATVQNKSGMQNAQIFVCDYFPGGNYGGAAPFDVGPACTTCSNTAKWCDSDGLCTSDCSSSSTNDCECKRVCTNGGTLDKVTCTCACPDGYYGDFCDKACIPASWCSGAYKPYCTPGNNYYTYVSSNCPNICELCVPK
jgi:hypothetical protein